MERYILQMTATDVVDGLAGHKTLGAAPPEELAWLASHGSLRQLRAGDVLTAKGAHVEGMFVVLSGRIAIIIDRGAGPRKITEWREGGDEPGGVSRGRRVHGGATHARLSGADLSVPGPRRGDALRSGIASSPRGT